VHNTVTSYLVDVVAICDASRHPAVFGVKWLVMVE
jgi:hypothetical protein